MSSTRMVTAFAAALSLAACSPGGPGNRKDQPPSTLDLQTKDIKAHMGMAMQHTDDPDADFMRAMIPHHEGAVEMAREELANGKDPAVMAVAEKIITDQQREIGQIKEWLARHRKDGDGPVSDQGGK